MNNVKHMDKAANSTAVEISGNRRSRRKANDIAFVIQNVFELPLEPVVEFEERDFFAINCRTSNGTNFSRS